jgi:hypothetical protein
MEPSGWIVRGLPANFVANVSPNEHQGELLDRPVVVRFEPVNYSWNWGDGTSDTFDKPGQRWEDLGVERFTSTATSHEYSDRGPVTVSVEVGYAVEYSFGDGSWTAVSGSVSATATLAATVVSAKTVLVDGDCAEDPSGPGC